MPSGNGPALGGASPAEYNRAVALLKANKVSEAVRVTSALAKAHPKVAAISVLLAQALASAGQFAKAEQAFRTSISLDPKLADAHGHYGHFLLRQSRVDEAVPVIVKALNLDPKRVSSLLDLGNALQVSRRFEAAARTLEQARELAPKNAQISLDLALIYLQDNRPEDAVAVLDSVVKNGKADALALTAYARGLAALGQIDQATSYFDKAIAQKPGLIQPISDKALFYQYNGRFDDAEALYLQLIDANPEIGQHYLSYLTTKKLAKDDPVFQTMLDAWDRPDLSDGNRSALGFALAKACEDSKQYERVFTYLKPANDLVRKHHPYDVAERFELAEALEAAYADASFERPESETSTPGTPIFVTGLPRSGTTLVEQIIASHSRVTGGGELGYARAELAALLRKPDNSYRTWDTVGDDEKRATIEKIQARMQGRFPGADLVTDKSVQTYPFMGPALSLTPGSKLVVVHRDPRATLLSIYKNKFADGMHLYSYDLSDLGEYFKAFQRILAFWRKKLAGRFYEITYEDLIADPETQTRDLIAACGLDWEDQCLSFHENKRRVDTLSVHQVRQPIYASSMKSWERYGDDLRPMLEALGPPYTDNA